MSNTDEHEASYILGHSEAETIRLGDRLIEHFAHAGLPEPNLFCETHVWGAADVPCYAWAVDTLRVLLPQLQQLGIVADEFMGSRRWKRGSGMLYAELKAR